MALVNVLSNKAMACISPLDEGLSDNLFQQGVRIIHPSIEKKEAIKWLKEQKTLDYVTYEQFVDAYKEEYEAREAYWIGAKASNGCLS